MPETDTKTQISQVATVIVPVEDQDTAVEFYCGKLGFEKRTDVPFAEGERWVEVAPPGAMTTIALMPPREGEPLGIDTRIALSSANIDADHADLGERGVDTDEEVIRMGGPVPPMFFLRDQDGNRLLVVEQG